MWARVKVERCRIRHYGRGAPPPLAEDESTKEHHAESDDARGGREGSHEGGVVRRVGEGLLELALPRDLDQIDRHAVRNHQRRQVADVGRGCQVPRRLPHGHRGLLLLLRGAGHGAGGLLLLDDGFVKVPVASRHDAASNNHRRHQKLECHAPGVDTCWEGVVQRRAVSHELS